MRKSRLKILPVRCLAQLGFLLLYISCPVLGDASRERAAPPPGRAGPLAPALAPDAALRAAAGQATSPSPAPSPGEWLLRGTCENPAAYRARPCDSSSNTSTQENNNNKACEVQPKESHNILKPNIIPNAQTVTIKPRTIELTVRYAKKGRRDTARLVRSERSAERRDADRLVRSAVDRRDTARLVRSERSAERRDADRLVRSAMERRDTARLVRSERSAERRDANRLVRPVLASESYVKYKTENFEIDRLVEFFLGKKNRRVEMKAFGFVDEEATIVPMFSDAAGTLNSTENVISGEREENIDSQRESLLLKKNDAFNFSMLNTDTLFSQVQVAHGYISEILLTVLGLRILESFAPWSLQGHNENDFVEQKSSGGPEVQLSGLEEKQHKRSDGDFLTVALTGSAAAVALLISDHVKQR